MIAKSLYIYAFAAIIFLSYYNNAVSSLIYRRTLALKKTIVGRPQHTRGTSSPLMKYQEKLMALRAGYVEDLAISVMVIGESLLWLKIWTYCAEKKFLEPNLTRKIIHTGSAPLFIFHWPLYSSLLYSKFIAAAIPLIQIIRLYRAGTSNASENSEKKSELISAVSRSGSKSEALGGPLIYSIILFIGTVLFFRESPVGIVAISQMAVGDGLADIVGRRWGKIKWPFSATKSIAGSTAFVLGGFVFSAVSLWLMNATGHLPFDISQSWSTLLLISVACAVVELFPIVDDNISVPVVAGLLAQWLLK